MKKSDAEALINAFIKLREGVGDDIASTSIIAYPTLKNNGKLINAGTRVKYKGELLRASVDLWDIEENNPDNAPSLWESINYKEGYRIIPEEITVGTAFSNGEIGWWENKKYISLIDSNVWTPDVYPSGWEEIS